VGGIEWWANIKVQLGGRAPKNNPGMAVPAL